MARQDKAEIQELGTYLNTQEIEKNGYKIKRISQITSKKVLIKLKNNKFDGTFIRRYKRLR